MITIELIISLAFAIIGVASVIVKITPSPKDDILLKKILDFMNKYLALNTSDTKFETNVKTETKISTIKAKR